VVKIVVLLAGCLALAACSGGARSGGLPYPEGGVAVAVVDAGIPYTNIEPGGGTFDFPGVGGYIAHFTYTENSATAIVGVNSSATLGALPGLPPPAPAGTPLVSFTFALASSVTFVNWNRIPSEITIPSSLSTAGHTFAVYGYDLTTGVAMGNNPGIVNGTTITFSPGVGPVTLTTDTYAYVLYED
jgi:hypothetical protein